MFRFLKAKPAKARTIENFTATPVKLRLVCDQVGTIMGISPALAALVARPTDALIGQPYWNFVDDETVAASIEKLDDTTMRGEAISTFVNCWLSANDERIWLDWSTEPIGADDLIYCHAKRIDSPTR